MEEEKKPPIPFPQRRTKDATSEAILNFFNTPVGMDALNSVSEQSVQTAKVAIYGLMGIVVTWATKRVLFDVLDIIMKINETRNTLLKKP